MIYVTKFKNNKINVFSHLYDIRIIEDKYDVFNPKYQKIDPCQLKKAIDKLKIVLEKKSVIKSKTVFNGNNKIDVGDFELNLHHGVCSVFENMVPNYLRYYIAQKFNDAVSVVFPVDFMSEPNYLWKSERRWEYVEHCITTMENILKMYDDLPSQK